MTIREEIAQARAIVIGNILANPRPSPDKMLCMSEPYKKVWEEASKPAEPERDELLDAFDTGKDDGPKPDWADLLD